MLSQRQQQKCWWWRWYWPGFHNVDNEDGIDQVFISGGHELAAVVSVAGSHHPDVWKTLKYFSWGNITKNTQMVHSIINDQSPQRWGSPWGPGYCGPSTPRSFSNPWTATLGSCSARGFWGEKNCWYSGFSSKIYLQKMLSKNWLSRWMRKMSLTDLWDCSMAGRRLHGSQKCCSSPCPWANNSR